MEREYHTWLSPAVGRQMELLVYGYGGARVIAFPVALGRFFDWEDHGMVQAVRDHLERGWLQLYCVDSIDQESWHDPALPPTDRARRQEQYDHYLVDELLPFTANRNSNNFVISTGANFGAYQAVNLALRHPQLVNRALGMSGFYDIKQRTDGYSDDAIYFNNPSDFMRHEHDPVRLEALRRMDIIIAIGRDDPALPNNEELAATLHGKGIPNALRVWDGMAHDWTFWQRMFQLYVGGSY